MYNCPLRTIKTCSGGEKEVKADSIIFKQTSKVSKRTESLKLFVPPRSRHDYNSYQGQRRPVSNLIQFKVNVAYTLI